MPNLFSLFASHMPNLFSIKLICCLAFKAETISKKMLSRRYLKSRSTIWCGRPPPTFASFSQKPVWWFDVAGHLPSLSGSLAKNVPRFDITKLLLFSCPYFLFDDFHFHSLSAIDQWRDMKIIRMPEIAAFLVWSEDTGFNSDPVTWICASKMCWHYCASPKWR